MQMTTAFNFVINCADNELDYYRTLCVEDNPHVFALPVFDWSLQTYLMLVKRKNLNVRLSTRPQKGCVNLLHSKHMIEEQGQADHFIVCLKADWHRRRWAHFHVVQNANDAKPYRAALPLWVQPGLVPRPADRSGLNVVAYAGQTFNGNLASSEAQWTEIFAQHGLRFEVLPPLACHDLSGIDVLIGIRSFDLRPYNNKPPSKLVNAWHARIPFIGGNDSAFAQVGSPGDDYIRVTTIDEAVQAVLHLRNNPELYRQLIANGVRKALLYSNEATAQRWEEVLTGPVTQRYRLWASRPRLERIRFGAFKSAGAVEHGAKQWVKKFMKKSTVEFFQRRLSVR